MKSCSYEIEVLSEEFIKPSSPTPDHLRRYQLSFFDQIHPPVFLTKTLFFSNDNINVSNMTTLIQSSSDILKKSLSETLSKYYILAGRIVENSFVDCNDEGVPFILAHAKCRVADIISNPVVTIELDKFIPSHRNDLHHIKHLPMAVQVSCFDCGGLSVSLIMAHKLGDVHSFVMFINAWAAIARGLGLGHDPNNNLLPLPPSPLFESSKLFPPRDHLQSFNLNTRGENEKIISKIFVFTASKITALCEMLSLESGGGIRPTRVEALSVFIWTRFMAARESRAKTGEYLKKIHTIQHPVNLRSRVEPRIPEKLFGNISQASKATMRMGNWDDKKGILEAIKEAIGKMNGEYLKQMMDFEEQYLDFFKELKGSLSVNEEVVMFRFTSMCRFPLYDADFGWGKPAWVGLHHINLKNLAMLMDTKIGNGIEAWIYLKEEDMAILELDPEFLSYASPINGSGCIQE